MKKIFTLIIVLAMVFSLVACGNDSSESKVEKTNNEVGDSTENETTNTEEPIRIGALYMLSGSLADSGANMQFGIDMAVEEINSNGGINGRQIEIIYGDTQGDAATGMTEAERLITQENVDVIMGCYQSSVTETVSQVAEAQQVPLITANATSDALTAHGYEYFFRLAPTNMMFLRDMVQYIKDYDESMADVEINSIAVCADNTEVGQQTAEWTEFWCKEHNIEFLGSVLYSSGAADLTSEVLQLKQYNADALIVDNYVSDAILLTKTLSEQNYKPQIMIGKGNGYTEDSYLESCESLANGIAVATEFFVGSKGKEISDKFYDTYEVEMNGHSAEAYTTAYVLGEALLNISNAGEEINSETIKNELQKINIDGKFYNGSEIIMPYSSISFTNSEFNGIDYKHQNMGGKLSVVQFQNGKMEAVWPAEISTSEIQFPASYN